MAAKAKFETTIQPWGNSLGLRITRAISDLSQLKKGSTVVVEVTDEGLFVRPKEPKKNKVLPFTENELVASLTPHKAHTDELPALQPSEVEDGGG